MSHFLFGKKPEKRIGVWIRPNSNPDVDKWIKRSFNKRLFETVRRIKVTEYDHTSNLVWLEIWCSNAFTNFIWGRRRYNVFYMVTEPNENWVCEGDLGDAVNYPIYHD